MIKIRTLGPVINMISGCPTTTRDSKISWKAYARKVMNIVVEALKHAKTNMALAFDDLDLERVKFFQDYPLVIIPMIGNNQVKCVLVDNGASVDILFHGVFLKIRYNDS